MRFLCLAAVLAVGCGHANYRDMAFAPEAEAPMATAMMDSSESMEMGEEAVAAGTLPEAKALERKIIYTAEVDLVVEDFSPIPSEVDALVKRFDGYVASSQVFGAPGSRRSGRWSLRVPVGHYREFLEAAQPQGLCLPAATTLSKAVRSLIERF